METKFNILQEAIESRRRQPGGQLEMPRFRKKQVEVEAVQYVASGEADEQIRKWAGGIAPGEPGICLAPGEWLVRHADGALVTFKPDAFEVTYEPVDRSEQEGASSLAVKVLMECDGLADVAAQYDPDRPASLLIGLINACEERLRKAAQGDRSEQPATSDQEEGGWPPLEIARDEDGAFEVAAAAGDDKGTAHYEQGGCEIRRYVPAPVPSVDVEEGERFRARKVKGGWVVHDREAARDLLMNVGAQKDVAAMARELNAATPARPVYADSSYPALEADSLSDLGMRPASAAHINLTAAVLRCLESGIEPATVVRFVDEELQEAGHRVPTDADRDEALKLIATCAWVDGTVEDCLKACKSIAQRALEGGDADVQPDVRCGGNGGRHDGDPGSGRGADQAPAGGEGDAQDGSGSHRRDARVGPPPIGHDPFRFGRHLKETPEK